jgi:ATP-dependent DNA helicase RecG
MEWLDVLQRIASGEDERTEFKRTLDPDSVGEAIAAFANTEGGLLVLGVDNGGNIVGLPSPPDKVSEKLTTQLQDGLSAPVQARIGRHQDPKGWVHWIEVTRQRGFEPLRRDNRVWVRRGRATVQPSTEERAIGGTSASDIDEQCFREFLLPQGIDLDAEPRIPFERDLIARGVMTEISPGEALATLYGWLAFGRRPQDTPQTASFWIECCEYKGLDRAADVAQVSQCRGRLDEQVLRALGWLRGLRKREVYDGAERRDLPLVPEIAAREAIVNAVAHRDYAILGSRILVEVFSDRVCVTSPGTLPNHMTAESVTRGAHPRSRNELIANFFLARGLMEGRGRGWPRMRKAMRELNGRDPELAADRTEAFVRVTFPIHPLGT